MVIRVFLYLVFFSIQAFSYNTLLTQKNCSGRIDDLSCYLDIQKIETKKLTEDQQFIRNKYKTYYYGQKIVIDTEDRQACEQVQNYLSQTNFSQSSDSEQLALLCDPINSDLEHRYQTVTILSETNQHFITEVNSRLLTNSEQTLLTDTRNLSYAMAGAIGLIWSLPQSISHWDRNDITTTGFLNKYKQNIRHTPVVDQDHWAINYIGHPISGAAYYTIARSHGSSKLQSFGYSVLMSTFFWEYGFEAIAEKPSIQDLIITPIIGSIIGEFFYQWSEKIKSNDGRLLGSKKVGNVALFVLNPAQEISKKVNQNLGVKFIQNAKTELILSRKKSDNALMPTQNYLGLQLKFQW